MFLQIKLAISQTVVMAKQCQSHNMFKIQVLISSGYDCNWGV